MADQINFKKAYEQIPTRVRSNPELRDALGLFVDHWGMDYYNPPEAAISAVRQIVQVVIGVADDSNLQNPQETPASSEPVKELVEALDTLRKYAVWQLHEGGSHHPTLRSAVDNAATVLNRFKGDA